MSIFRLKNNTGSDSQQVWANNFVFPNGIAIDLLETSSYGDPAIEYSIGLTIDDLLGIRGGRYFSNIAELIRTGQWCLNDGDNDLTTSNALFLLKYGQSFESKAIIEYTDRYGMKGIAVEGICAKNSTTAIDLLLQNEPDESAIFKFLWGGTFFGKGINFGDYVRCQVVDKDGWLVATGQIDQATFDAIKPVVIKEYIVKFYIHPLEINEIYAESPGKIPVGLYLRCLYTNTSATQDAFVMVNYNIHNKDLS
jgi:hypothetical protein